MTGALYGLANRCVRRRWAVIAVWLVITVALVAVSHGLGEKTNDNLSLPGTGSSSAKSTLSGPFPAQANGSSPIVLHVRSGKLTEPKYKQAVDEAAEHLAKAKHVAGVVNPLTPQGASALSKDQATGYLSVTLDVSPGELSVDEAHTVIDAAAGPAQAGGIQVETGGQLGQKVSKPATESSELVGILAAFVILAFTLGTLTAMVLPILVAIFGLLSTLAIIRMLGHVLTVPTVAPTLATMIGLGVGIDYALFIVTRHFRGLSDGMPLGESIARAAATSGGAVIFAGSTVAIALVSLAVAQIPLVTTLGLMAAIAVLVAMLAAVTLLPALLGALGGQIESLRVRPPYSADAARKGVWAKWAGEIAKRPVISGLAALAILIPLTIPLLSLNLGQQDPGALSTSTTARRAYDLLAKNFGAGVNGPLLIAVKLKTPAEPAPGESGGTGGAQDASSSQGGTTDPRASDPRLASLQKDVAANHDVAAVGPIQIDKAGTVAYFNAIAKQGPSENATASLVESLRSEAIPKAEAGGGLSAYVGGSTAAYVDLASKISAKLPLQIIVVIALSLLLLTVAFRTVVVPPQAALMNVLSIGAAYGVLTAIFQYGWLSGAIGLSGAVPIVSYVPLFMFAILFGLSMDYEVFLVSQISEHVHEGENNSSAVVSGLVTSARVITAAALIMVFVFGSFLLNGDPTVKQFGVGLAVAVLLDATVVRCLLVPALMILVGRANWFFPRWMERLVPRLSIEGEEFFAARDRQREDPVRAPGPSSAEAGAG
ncbi:MAG TPA: MMPL family transporter [Solirubrobacteraceae bacterium]|jgi:RND superfamily putative drug exporter|nr:MMPL family transporter [Solirubrobacteraceae bacterium]